MFRALYVGVAVLLLVAGCADAHKSYIGFWLLDDSAQKQILQISKDGETYLMDDNILRSIDLFGRPKKPMVLTKSDDQLLANNGFGAIPLGLSDDKDTLHADNRTYSRISPEKVEEIKAVIEQEAEEYKKNISRCKELERELQEKLTKLNTVTELSERVQQSKALSQEYKDKSKTVSNCVLLGAGW